MRWLAIAHLDIRLLTELVKYQSWRVKLRQQFIEATVGSKLDQERLSKTCPQWPEGTDKRIELPGG
jgi:hypothetical protein